MIKIKNLLQSCVSFCIHGHLKKRTLQIQMTTIKESFHLHTIFYHLARATIGNLDDNQASMKIIPNIIEVFTSKFWVHHTQHRHLFMVWEFAF
jgi:hypothetical protein